MSAARESAGAVRLELNDLSRAFGGVHAVDDLSFTVAQGEMVAVVGPNGAGKSTLFQLISGVLKPDAGSIRLDGTELVGRSPDAIAGQGVGRTFQTSRVFPALTVWDSVRVGQTPALLGRSGGQSGRLGPLPELTRALFAPAAFRTRQRALDEAAGEALRLFGDRLWPRRRDRADSLSYANRRRLEIARALVARPRLLLLDEPTAGMNPTETGELARLIGELHQRQPETTVVLVEHKLDVVRDLASRVLVMERGRLLAEGAPRTVLEDPRVIEAYLGGPTGSGERAAEVSVVD